jgi:ketosteroid isomerase-like protein
MYDPFHPWRIGRMLKNKDLHLVLVTGALFSLAAQNPLQAQLREGAPQNGEEIQAVEKVIHNVFGWAVKKDFPLFFQTIADDSNFISVTPYDRVKFGFADVREDSAFWGSPFFKAIRHEIRDLKIHFSHSGDVAWFYCVVSDFNEWKGKPANWENVRWTGVLEKREGKWRVVQQHFSYPKKVEE